MGDARRTFLETVEWCRPVLASPRVAGHWQEQSVLAEFTVRGLAGHLGRSAVVALDYLQKPVPAGVEPIGSAAYYAKLVTSTDVQAPANVSIRQRGEEFAVAGHEALIRRFDEGRRSLALALAREPQDRLVQVSGDLVLRLDDYLVTRMVEMLVHTDDLALSLGLPTPVPPADAAALAVGCLVDVARLRHGDLAVLRALTRRERDEIGALRVI